MRCWFPRKGKRFPEAWNLSRTRRAAAWKMQKWTWDCGTWLTVVTASSSSLPSSSLLPSSSSSSSILRAHSVLAHRRVMYVCRLMQFTQIDLIGWIVPAENWLIGCFVSASHYPNDDDRAARLSRKRRLTPRTDKHVPDRDYRRHLAALCDMQIAYSSPPSFVTLILIVLGARNFRRIIFIWRSQRIL